MTDYWLLSADERGVSPLISVILLVAITVILAAVISVFALGITEDVTDAAPVAEFDIENVSSVDGVTIVHSGGDTIHGENLRFAGAATEKTAVGSISEWSGNTVESGDTATVETGSGILRLIWEDDGSSATLATFNVRNTTTTVQIQSVVWTHFSQDITVKTGEVANIKGGSVYIVYEDGEGAALGSNEQHSYDPGYPLGSHTFTVWKTDKKNTKVCDFTIERNSWTAYISETPSCSA